MSERKSKSVYVGRPEIGAPTFIVQLFYEHSDRSVPGCNRNVRTFPEVMTTLFQYAGKHPDAFRSIAMYERSLTTGEQRAIRGLRRLVLKANSS